MSTEPYTPSKGVVRVAYRNRKPGSAYFAGVGDKDPDAEFERFIEEVRKEAQDEIRSEYALTRANIRKIKADIWDEGESDGFWNHEHASMIERGNREAITNPYRIPEDEADTPE